MKRTLTFTYFSLAALLVAGVATLGRTAVNAPVAVARAPGWPLILWGGGTGIDTSTPARCITSYQTNRAALQMQCAAAGGMFILVGPPSIQTGGYGDPGTPVQIGPNYFLQRLADCVVAAPMPANTVTPMMMPAATPTPTPTIDYVAPEILPPLKVTATPTIDYVGPESIPPLNVTPTPAK